MKQALSLFFRLLVTVIVCYAVLLLPNPWLGFSVLAAVLVLRIPLRALIHRRRFMRRLKRLCRERNADLEIQRGWCPRLIIRTEVGSFACVVIPGLFRGIPLLLDDDGKGYRFIWGIRIPARGGVRSVSRTGILRGSLPASESRVAITKAYACYLAPGHKLTFPAGYTKKFVIVNPMPQNVLAGMVQSYMHIDNGERICGQYSVYTGGAFCDFLDRQTANYLDQYGRDL
ncbi:MAG: hypothetical protein J6D21_09310 [Clostridia bacterium]|nr:hypothetical protein [Clostridia bacterium]